MTHKLKITDLKDWTVEHILASLSNKSGIKRLLMIAKPADNKLEYTVISTSSPLLDESGTTKYYGSSINDAIEEYNKW